VRGARTRRGKHRSIPSEQCPPDTPMGRSLREIREHVSSCQDAGTATELNRRERRYAARKGLTLNISGSADGEADDARI
jgi:hypothetical protein